MSNFLNGIGTMLLAVGSGMAVSALVGGTVGALAGPMIGGGIFLLIATARFKS